MGMGMGMLLLAGISLGWLLLLLLISARMTVRSRSTCRWRRRHARGRLSSDRRQIGGHRGGDCLRHMRGYLRRGRWSGSWRWCRATAVAGKLIGAHM